MDEAYPIDRIDEVYRFLLSELDLKEEHQKKLIQRGFTEKQIQELGYKSYPVKRAGIADRCAQKCSSVEGVPGFYKTAAGVWQLAGMSGLIVPVRNSAGQIATLKIRSDHSETKGKYLHLSSDPKLDKAGKTAYAHGAKAVIHVHHPSIGKPTKTIRITEGELKADIATLMTSEYTISIPGIAMWQWALDAIEKLQPTKVLIALDSDKDKSISTSTTPDAKPFAVAKAVANLYLSIKQQEIEVAIEHWDSKYGKGIDDVLAEGFSDMITELSEEDAQKFVRQALADEMPMEWVYVIGTKRFVNTETMMELDKEQFADRYASSCKGDASRKMIKNPSFPKVDNPVYAPQEPLVLERHGHKLLNLWRPTDIKPADGDVTKFLEHTQYILPKEEEQQVLLDFLAYNVQHAGKKIHWAVLLQGLPGTGKSYYGKLMRMLLGKHNVSNPSNEAIHESYTGWQKSCQLIVVEELMARGRLELMNKLKPMITQEISVVREMYKPPYEQPNVFNMLLFTNHEDAIILDEHDRRYCVLYSPAVPQSPQYYKELWDWTDNNAGALLHYMQQRNLSAFEPYAHAPMTAGKQKLIDESRHPLEQWILEGMDTNTYPFNSDLVAIRHLLDYLPNHLKGTTPQQLNKALRACKGEPLGKYQLQDGTTIPLYAMRRHDMWKSASDEAIVKEYTKGTGDTIAQQGLAQSEGI